MSYWQDKVVLITGGAAGLGLRLATHFARAARSWCWRMFMVTRWPERPRNSASKRPVFAAW